jgi:signal transduction histidine kinase
MPCPDDADDVPQPDALDQLRHDLKTPLTTIHARSQLLGRAIRRSPSLTDDEQAWMLETLATIDEAVRTMVTVIDAMGRDGAERSSDSWG